MAVALESNPEGTLHLIESGCYGHTGTRANGYQFDDPSLSDWTDRSSDGPFSVSAGVLSVDKALLLMWNSPSVSPQHTLPNSQIITTLRNRWIIDGAPNQSDYVPNAVSIMSTIVLPWQTGGYASGTGGIVIFSTGLWTFWTYENGTFVSLNNNVLNDPPSVLHWFGNRVEADGITVGRDCSGGGLNLLEAAAGQPDCGFTLRTCRSANFGLAGNPGLFSFQGTVGPGDGTEYLEWHAFFDTKIKVIGLPTGWKAKVIKVGDAARDPASTTNIESGGEAFPVVVGSGTGSADMPPWDEVQVLDALDVVQHSIKVRTFQPGTYGGDVYTMGPVDAPPPPPTSCPTIESGVTVVTPDCDSGVSVTFPDCDVGASVTFPAGDIGIIPCP